jgi:hypothetical protein
LASDFPRFLDRAQRCLFGHVHVAANEERLVRYLVDIVAPAVAEELELQSLDFAISASSRSSNRRFMRRL